MTDDTRSLELDLEPRGDRRDSAWEALVPLHADNFALALASGYVGGSLKEDAAKDFQSPAGEGLLGFNDSVPTWALSEGEPGDRVIVAIPREGPPPEHGQPAVFPGPVRVTNIKWVGFRDDGSLANFVASYDAFPDVATSLVEKVVKWPVTDEPERPGKFNIESPLANPRRTDLDFFGGFGAGVVSLLAGSQFDDALRRFLQDPGNGIAENARSLLHALEPRSSSLDSSIWSAAVEALRKRFGKKGFDRREFLADIEASVISLGAEAESWVRGCQKVIDAEIDIPSLADNEKIGRRAALAIILSHEPSGLDDLEENLEAGSMVCALVTAAVHAFAGLSRADEALKTPAARMDAVLEIGERLLAGKAVEVKVETSRIAGDLTRHQLVTIAGNKALEKAVEPPAYMVMLKARIQEAGYKVELDEASGRIGIRSGKAKGEFITVEDCPSSAPANPVVNLVTPVMVLGARPSVAVLKKMMSGAWEHATTVALREVDGKEEVVAMASLPLATLDRDELNFHVERLLQVSADLGGKPKKSRRVKKLGA
ncbi:hypothetical protein ACMC5O_002347 [Sphingomonas sediminicola]|uniref:hypothetical protein n=1 Tax=Sphingomonas sediminicola TaxID=386874 RepID=UPI003CF3D443